MKLNALFWTVFAWLTAADYLSPMAVRTIDRWHKVIYYLLVYREYPPSRPCWTAEEHWLITLRLQRKAAQLPDTADVRGLRFRLACALDEICA